ncbi:MAG: LemA family protein [Tissierellia bacterium]|nr:LemA family protein [Tissierellia bacterium]
MKKGFVILIAILLIAGFFMTTYNGLIDLSESVDNSWAQVENVLKQRADLIPNLVETVKGYADHESEVFIKVTEARSKVMKARTPEEYAEANEQLDRAMVDINAVAEAYPDLKANENFLSLQAELTSIENKLATERLRYNDNVKVYNVEVKKFPKKIFANILGFGPREYFQINEADKEAPKVNF